MATKLSELSPGTKLHRALARRVLAVLSRREEGWSVYVDAVEGQSHDDEWQLVAQQGSKQLEPIARAIVRNLGYPEDFQLEVVPHALAEVPLAADQPTYPLLLISHGFGGTPEIYTTLVEEVASHGYVVFSLPCRIHFG